MKAVLISIQPKYCELIALGKKTVEVRKTKPKIDVPFKCYIYCTKGKFEPHEHLRNNLHYDDSTIKVCEGQGKVIGEFVCDRITEIKSDAVYSKVFGGFDVRFNFDIGKACLTQEQIIEYLGEKTGYAWHISNLVLYDKPKELGEFKRDCNGNCDSCKYAISKSPMKWYDEPKIVGCKNISVPQSWCYVWEVEDGKF
ncbi:MAG: hypothetical protein IJX51_08690 [Clostridia bacterium]|nr:hypothetical protein [Clostridia bacterium]